MRKRLIQSIRALADAKGRDANTVAIGQGQIVSVYSHGVFVLSVNGVTAGAISQTDDPSLTAGDRVNVARESDGTYLILGRV